MQTYYVEGVFEGDLKSKGHKMQEVENEMSFYEA